MIDNSAKVKDLIKNLANGESGKAQLLQRRYAMERFLERMAESEYKNNLVLKGGMLVTSMLGLGQRMTRDTDVTMLDMALDVESAVKMTKAIAAIAKMRDHDVSLANYKSAIEALADSKTMVSHWTRYQSRNDFAAGVSWEDVLDAVRILCGKANDAGNAHD